METVGNVNHAVSIVGYWIFDSNYKKSLLLKLESLNQKSLPGSKQCFTHSDTSITEENLRSLMSA